MSSYQFVSNAVAGTVLNAANNQPESKVIIWEKKSSNVDSELWKFEDGFLINRASGYVLEAPLIDGKMKPGTELIQVERRSKDNLNQKWKYDQYRLVSVFDDSLCIWGENGNVWAGNYSIVDTIQQNAATQRWLFLPA